MPEFRVIIARKIFFPILGGRGARVTCPLSPSPTPIKTAESGAMIKLKINDEQNWNENEIR